MPPLVICGNVKIGERRKVVEEHVVSGNVFGKTVGKENISFDLASARGPLYKEA